MKDEYILFLDESETKGNNFFGIAGCIIKKNEIEALKVVIEECKSVLWDSDIIEKDKPILHSTDLNKVYANRNRENKRSIQLDINYKKILLKSSEEIERAYNTVYNKLNAYIRLNNITILSCILNMKLRNELFSLETDKNSSDIQEEKYKYGIQMILQQFSHFLQMKNGVGYICYESRNTKGENATKSPDVVMFQNFCEIIANNRGVNHLNDRVIREKIRNLEFRGKDEDLPGLQLADFIACNLVKYLANPGAGESEFIKNILKKAYNGKYRIEDKDVRYFWGTNVFPMDWDSLSQMKESNKRLVRANRNLKKSIKKQEKKNERLIEEKKKIEEKLKKLELMLNTQQN